ncbi:hypothetical protein [Undibacterium crateris]|uniref:hypothetical protein n=1 Tax=Undibacterium crateris TaxID=2528175 RepID=UPI001389E136|nr:hypothetical protein [Undibacterium crateris]NDI84222.1 hypothetical protein [Undibacterium crateris]
MKSKLKRIPPGVIDVVAEREKGMQEQAVEDALDTGLEETFPASDPVAITITPASAAVLFTAA